MTHSHVWHDSFTCVTWLVHAWDITHIHVWHDSFTCVTWLTHMRDMSHAYVWRDSCRCVTWLVHVCDVTRLCNITLFNKELPHARHDSCTCVTCLTRVRDMTHVYEWRDSFICVTWQVHVCDVIRLCDITLCNKELLHVRHDWGTCVTCLTRVRDMTHVMCDMTRSYVWHDSFICVTWLACVTLPP